MASRWKVEIYRNRSLFPPEGDNKLTVYYIYTNDRDDAIAQAWEREYPGTTPDHRKVIAWKG